MDERAEYLMGGGKYSSIVVATGSHIKMFQHTRDGYPVAGYDFVLVGEQIPFVTLSINDRLNRHDIAHTFHKTLDYLAQICNPHLVPAVWAKIAEKFHAAVFSVESSISVRKIAETENFLVAGFCILMSLHRHNISSPETLRIAKAHYQRFANNPPTTTIDAEKFLDPFAMRYGNDSWAFFKLFEQLNASDTSTLVSRETFHRLYCSLSDNIESGTRFADVPLVPVTEMVLDQRCFEKAASVPFSTKDFRDFLYSCTVGDLRKVFGRLKKSSFGLEAVTVGQAIIAARLEPINQSPEETVPAAADLCNFITCSGELDEEELLVVNSLVIRNHNKPAMMKMAKEIFTDFDNFFPSGESRERAAKMIEFFMAPVGAGIFRKYYNIDEWITQSSYANTIIELFLQIKEPVEVFEIITRAGDEGVTLDAVEWIELIGCPQLLDSPPSWWKSLV